MYKSHLELISSMPESFDDEDEQQTAESIIAKNDAEEIAEKVAAGADSQLSAKTIKNAYESRFGDLKFGQNGQNPEE
ncbi:divIVA domain [Ruminococcus sp. CAG:624]|nr:divIVA domain [Ruminococcus sp. CAG:624]